MFVFCFLSSHAALAPLKDAFHSGRGNLTPARFTVVFDLTGAWEVKGFVRGSGLRLGDFVAGLPDTELGSAAYKIFVLSSH